MKLLLFDEKMQKLNKNVRMAICWDYMFGHFIVLLNILLYFETFKALIILPVCHR